MMICQLTLKKSFQPYSNRFNKLLLKNPPLLKKFIISCPNHPFLHLRNSQSREKLKKFNPSFKDLNHYKKSNKKLLMNLKATINTKKNSSFKIWFSKKNNWISKINFKIKLINSKLRKRSNLNNFSILWKCLKIYEPKDSSIKTKFNLFL